MNILLLSTYELGHQPLALARPAALLRDAGHQVRCLDLAVERFDAAAVHWAELIGISVPMHTATRLGVRLAERVRELNPHVHLCFYGLYASLNADALLGRYADSVIGGEFEQPLVALAARLAGAESHGVVPGVITLEADGQTFLGRQRFTLPARDLLPPLERYSRLDDGTRLKLVGYVEASRGCAHRCLHCPITPVYGGRLRIVQEDVVLEDIRRLVAMGAEHITFGDPDFFNGIKHSCRIVQALHAEFPDLTYDATIKIEHLLEHRALLPLLRETGCVFVTSAVEAIDDRILRYLQKGHTRADVEHALALMEEVGLPLRPTFLPFTPWTTLEGYLDLLDFIEQHGLIPRIDPVQLAIRLLVPRGSSLIGTPALDGVLGPFDPETFTYTWRHPDARVDALQEAVARVVEQAARSGEAVSATFYRIKSLALAAMAGRSLNAPPPLVGAAAGAVPRLTEPWFC